MSVETATVGKGAAQTDAAELACITVTYHPDLSLLAAQIGGLPESARKIIVDNGSDAGQLLILRDLVARSRNVELIENSRNLGLAAGLNRGAAEALSSLPKPEFLLFLDQDSEPAVAGVRRLIEQFRRLEARGCRPGCIGPRMVDPQRDLAHGFHQIVGWRWVQRFPSPEQTEAVPLANLNGSGTLVRSSLFTELGGFEEDFFIDHVDTEWSFRVLAAGYRLFGIPDVAFVHRMGERCLRYWLFGWRLWPYRAPQRHYYLFRNAARLMGRSTIPRVWKFWACVKLILTFAVHLAFDGNRKEQALGMWKGVSDGLRLR